MGLENVLLRSEGRRIPGVEARRLRLAAALSLRDVAEAVGVTHSAVYQWEMGQRSPRGVVAERYAEFLKALRCIPVNTLPAAAAADSLAGHAVPASGGSTAVDSESLAARGRGSGLVPPVAPASTEPGHEDSA